MLLKRELTRTGGDRMRSSGHCSRRGRENCRECIMNKGSALCPYKYGEEDSPGVLVVLGGEDRKREGTEPVAEKTVEHADTVEEHE